MSNEQGEKTSIISSSALNSSFLMMNGDENVRNVQETCNNNISGQEIIYLPNEEVAWHKTKTATTSNTNRHKNKCKQNYIKLAASSDDSSVASLSSSSSFSLASFDSSNLSSSSSSSPLVLLKRLNSNKLTNSKKGSTISKSSLIQKKCIQKQTNLNAKNSNKISVENNKSKEILLIKSRELSRPRNDFKIIRQTIQFSEERNSRLNSNNSNTKNNGKKSETNKLAKLDNSTKIVVLNGDKTREATSKLIEKSSPVELIRNYKNIKKKIINIDRAKINRPSKFSNNVANKNEEEEDEELKECVAALVINLNDESTSLRDRLNRIYYDKNNEFSSSKTIGNQNISINKNHHYHLHKARQLMKKSK